MKWLWSLLWNIFRFLFGSTNDNDGSFLCSGDSNGDDPPAGCSTQQMLNEFAKLHGQDSAYDGSVWNRIRTCLDDTKMLEASDQSWRSFVALGRAGENGWADGGSPWNEFNPTPLSGDNYADAEGIVIAEPCNAVSNFAFYRSAVELCETTAPWSFADEAVVPALVTTFANLAFGSTFYHAADTQTSFLTDIAPIDIISFVAYQAAVAELPYDPILFDLRDTPFNVSAVDIANELLTILSSTDTTDWNARLRGLPTYSSGPGNFFETAFTSLIGLALELIFGGETTVLIATPLLDLLSPESKDFFFNKYLPTVRQALAERNVRPSLTVRVNLLLQFLGTAIKLMYAFLWQEEVIQGFVVTDATVNALGAKLGFVVNGIANGLTRFDRTDGLVQLQINVYPGDSKCRAEQAHSKWHESAGNGLVDLVFLADAMNRIISLEPKEMTIPSLRNLPIQLCDVPDDTLVDDDDGETRMMEWADCVITSNPFLACGRDCLNQGDIGECVWHCFRSLDE